MKIYTLGTSNRNLKDFLEILKFYQVEVLIDVRHWPTSRLFPHFKKENLERFLRENGIEYFHLENLGGYRQGGYQAYCQREEFKKGLDELINISFRKRTAIICAERFPWKCHRRFIAQELEKRNFSVIHIIDKERIWQPKREERKNSS